MKKISKTEALEEIEKFFSDVKNKTPGEIKKIKKLAMRNSIQLKEKRKLFCKKCFEPYSGKEKVGIKNSKKIIECLGCKNISQWGI